MDPAIAPIEVLWVLIRVVICPFEKDVFGSIVVVYYIIVSTIIKRSKNRIRSPHFLQFINTYTIGLVVSRIASGVHVQSGWTTATYLRYCQ